MVGLSWGLPGLWVCFPPVEGAGWEGEGRLRWWEAGGSPCQRCRATHQSFAVESVASPAWRRADTTRAEMLFLGCRGTRGVKVVPDRVNGNSTWESGSQRSVFTIVC